MGFHQLILDYNILAVFVVFLRYVLHSSLLDFVKIQINPFQATISTFSVLLGLGLPMPDKTGVSSLPKRSKYLFI